MLRLVAGFAVVASVFAAAPARAQFDECNFGFAIDTQSSAFQSILVDGEEKSGFWLSINRAPSEVRELARFVGRLQVCMTTPDGRPATVNRNGQTLQLDSPFVANCTATLLPDNRLLTNRHCFYDPDLVQAGFSIVYEARVNFGYTSKDDIGSVRTYRVVAREIAMDPDLDAMVLQVIGDPNADLGGHIPMQMTSRIERFQQLLVIHHPSAKPQQFSTGTCQVHRRQTEIAATSSVFRHTCETTGGSSGALIFDARTFAVVALHNQGGLNLTGDSYNGGHKIAMIEAAMSVGFQEADAARSKADTSESDAVIAFGEAMGIPDLEARIAALKSVEASFPETRGAVLAAEARSRAADALRADDSGVRETPDDTKPPSASVNFSRKLSVTGTKRLQERHQAAVTEIAFSNDGQRFVTASEDTTARVWGTEGGKEISVLRGHEGRISSVDISPDGKFVVTAEESVLRLWDAETGREIDRRPVLAYLAAQAVAFSPSGRFVAYHSGGKTVRLWDLEGETGFMAFEGHDSLIWDIAFSPDGRYLATASDDATVRVWDVETREQVAYLNHFGGVHAVVFSQDGRYLATGGEDGVAYLWNTISWKEITSFEVKGSYGYGWVRNVSFSAENDWIFIVSTAGDWNVFDLQSGTSIFHRRSGGVAAALSPDSRVIVCGDNIGGVSILSRQ